MEDKKGFVEDLGNLFSKYYSDVEKMEYFKPGKEYKEEVVITRKCSSYKKTINVSFDSIPAIFQDIARNLEL